jgi:hypothetical protein
MLRPSLLAPFGFLTAIAMLLPALPARAQSAWPMLGHDVRRSGATADELRPPFERKWYRLFPEGIMTGIQPVVSAGRVFIGTLHGAVHGVNAATGEDVWRFSAGGAVLHACAVADGKVFFGCADGKVYAVSASDGKLIWTFQTGSAVWNSPLVHGGTLYIGSRDARLYALKTEDGALVWKAALDGPILYSPALDPVRSRLYVGAEDMRIRALDPATGREVWRSEKLPGVSLRGYHPVIAPDGSVMVTVVPAPGLIAFNPLLLEMVKEIFGDFASWRHNKEENARLRAANFQKFEEPGTYQAQLDYLRRRLAAQPAYQTFFVLDPETGKQKFVAPIVYAESMNGPGAPPVVTPGGKVIVKYQVLLRSRYEHYSPFLNVGYLDTATGHITPIMDQSRTYGWHDSLLLIHDEQSQLAVSGDVLINTHQDNVNAMDLLTLQGYGEPFARNIHEPQPGEAAAIWARHLRGQPLPPGKEWLARGTAVYGGGSAIDVPIAIAGDSFYYLPTHEINAGVALIAYRMQPGGNPKPSSPLVDTLSTEASDQVQQLQWDWDTLGIARLNHLLKALPKPVPGTKQNPLTDTAQAAVAQIMEEDLTRFILSKPKFNSGADASLTRELAGAVRELIGDEWRPLLFPAGTFPEESYRFFHDPAATLYTLALAYPHLEPDLQRDVKTKAARMLAQGGPLGKGTAARIDSAGRGAVRSAYEHPPETLLKIMDHPALSPLAKLYPFWLWATVADDWGFVETRWADWKPLVSEPPGDFAVDCHNSRIAGLIAWCRLAERMNDSALPQGLSITRSALRDRLTFELAHTRGGLIYQIPKQRSVFSRWENLTPDLAALLREHAREIHASLMQSYVDHHRPTWWLAWNVETMMRNECSLQFPSVPRQIFTARALVLDEDRESLRKFLDLPWCRADEYQIQKLALALAAKRSGTD